MPPSLAIVAPLTLTSPRSMRFAAPARGCNHSAACVRSSPPTNIPLPSGAHATGKTLRSSAAVTLFAAGLPTGETATSVCKYGVPCKATSNASILPSGENDGLPLQPLLAPNGRTFPVATSTRATVPLSKSALTVLGTISNAIALPSGDQSTFSENWPCGRLHDPDVRRLSSPRPSADAIQMCAGCAMCRIRKSLLLTRNGLSYFAFPASFGAWSAATYAIRAPSGLQTNCCTSVFEDDAATGSPPFIGMTYTSSVASSP